MEDKTKTKTTWGGKRAGAGRKQGVKIGPIGHRKENPRNKMLSFRVSEVTLRRINQLRDLTKEDSTPFVEMLDKWVAELAQDYGID